MSSGAQETLDPVAMLSDRLGVDEERARDLANVAIACPVRGEDRQTSLGEFMVSDHGAEKAGTVIDLAAQAKEKGANEEEALSQALGFAAIRDKSGGLARVIPAESVPEAESKKK